MIRDRDVEWNARDVKTRRHGTRGRRRLELCCVRVSRVIYREEGNRRMKNILYKVSRWKTLSIVVLCPLVDCVSELSNDKLYRKPIRNSFLDPLHSYMYIHPPIDINVHLSIEEKGEHLLSW